MIEHDQDKLIEWLDDHANHIGDNGFEYNYECPFCGGTQFFVNIDSGSWICHHARKCGKRGRNPAYLIAELDGVSLKQAEQLLQDDSDPVITQEAIQRVLEQPQTVQQPVGETSGQALACSLDGMAWLTMDGTQLGQQEARDFIEGDRGFDPAWFINNYHPLVGLWGMVSERLILPHLRDSYPIFYQARDMTGEQEPKYLNTPIEFSKVRRKDLVWNEIRLQHPQRIIVVAEGIFKAVAFERVGYAAVATYGAGISDSQLVQLSKCNTDLIAVAPDKGMTGLGMSFAEMWREKLSKPLAACGKHVVQLDPPPAGDYDSISQEELTQRVVSARPISGPYAR